MFGFRSAVPGRAHRSLLEAENALSTQSSRHPDGWGIGWFVDDDAYVLKSASSAHQCHRFQRASERLLSQTFLVHVRKATVGQVDPINAHPFRFGRWLFCHNGTLFDYPLLEPWLRARTAPDLQALLLGDTDSEALFFYLLTALHTAGLDRTGRVAADGLQVAAVVREALAALDARAVEAGLERPIVNLLLTDGRLMIAHRAGMPLWLSTQKHACGDAPTCTAPKVCLLAERPRTGAVNHLLVASEPIGATENRWEPVLDGTTLVLDPSFQLHQLAPAPGWTAPELPERFRATLAEIGACSP